MTPTPRDPVGGPVEAALVPMVASLAPWGVTEAHWLPDAAGAPVVWLRTRTRAQRSALEGQAFLVPQVQVTLSRLGLAHDLVWSIRVEVTSAEDEARLFEE